MPNTSTACTSTISWYAANFQIRRKRVDAARAMQREKDFWEQATEKWRRDNEEEEEKTVNVAKVAKTKGGREKEFEIKNEFSFPQKNVLSRL